MSGTNQNPPILREVHPCVFFAKDIISGEAKYTPFNPDPATPLDLEKTVYTNYTSKRPVIPPVWVEKANKIVQMHSATTTPVTTPKSGQKDPFLIKFSIPTFQYADEVLKLGDMFEAKNTIPALVTPDAKRRNRYGGGGFVAEKYRIPLSLYSTDYMNFSGSDYVELLVESSRPQKGFFANNAVEIDHLPQHGLASINKSALEQEYGITITRFGHGDYNNASDIIVPILFKNQYQIALQTLQNVTSAADLSVKPSHPSTPLECDENPDLSTVLPNQHPFLDNFIHLPSSMKLDYQIPNTSYICTHAPTESTTSLFYQLMFEQKCKLVVGLTPCDSYWPCSNTGESKCDEDLVGNVARFGHFLVRIDKIERFTESKHVIARHVTVTQYPLVYEELNPNDPRKDPKNADSHQCILLQYLNWPDMGIPNIHCFIDFFQIFKLVQKRLEQTAQTVELAKSSPPAAIAAAEGETRGSTHTVKVTTPVLVHCMAGIGRTGTFIMIDMLWTHLQSVLNSLVGYWEKTGTNMAAKSENEKRMFFSGLFNSRLLLNMIPYLLLCLRSARFQMVQTSQQLIFIAEFLENYTNSYLHSFILSK